MSRELVMMLCFSGQNASLYWVRYRATGGWMVGTRLGVAALGSSVHTRDRTSLTTICTIYLLAKAMCVLQAEAGPDPCVRFRRDWAGDQGPNPVCLLRYSALFRTPGLSATHLCGIAQNSGPSSALPCCGDKKLVAPLRQQHQQQSGSACSSARSRVRSD